jgi:hypothetical protein
MELNGHKVKQIFTKYCEICSEEFKAYNPLKKVCSPQCYNEANKKYQSVRNRKRTTGAGTFTCRWCNKTKVKNKYERCPSCKKSVDYQDCSHMGSYEIYCL